ncbi:tetratricopeptide repeat protein [bacterium]|nr:tetratricopeptide repeat protein [candidate division CSSED10-310 bacterium]
MIFPRSVFSRSLLCAIMLAGCFPAFAQDDLGASAGISQLWARQLESFEKGTETADCGESQLDILEFLLDNGIQRAPEIGAAYTLLGLEAEKQGRWSDAQWAFDAALQVDKLNVPAARAALANARHLGIGEGFNRLNLSIRLAIQRMLDIGVRHILIGNTALALIVAFVLFGVTTICVISIRQLALAIFELHSRISFISDIRITGTALILALILLAISPIGLPGLLILLLMIAFAFGERKQRTTLWIAWLLMLAVFPLSIIHIASIILENNHFFRVSRYTLTGGYSEPAVSDLKRLAERETNQEKRARISFVLGMLYKKGGFFNDAHRELERYQEVNPRDAGVYINLGNIEFINDRIKTATEMYRKAESLDPQNPLIYFNLSKAYLSQFRFEEAKDMQNRAAKLDPIMTGKLNAVHSSKPVRMVVDIDIPKTWMFEEAINALKASINHADDYWRFRLIQTDFKQSLIIWAIISLILLLLPLLSHSVVLSRFCLKCGKPMKPDVLSGGTDHICVTCHMVYFKKSEGAKIRQAGSEATSGLRLNWDSIMHRVLSCVLPGAGRLYSGYMISGLIMILFWTVAAGILLASVRFIPSFYRIPSGILGIGRYLLIGVIILDYVISIRWGLLEEDV